MSSFKRKVTGKHTLNVYPGTRISPASNLSLITSTGISSLDDILGGGLPLSCSLVFAAPDIHSSYGDLIQKYFVAQGLAIGHCVCLVASNPRDFLKDVMWAPQASQSSTAFGDAVAANLVDDEDETDDQHEESQKVKIAWRYEKMSQFKTTVGASAGASSYVVVCPLPADAMLKRLPLPEKGSPIAKLLTFPALFRKKSSMML